MKESGGFKAATSLCVVCYTRRTLKQKTAGKRAKPSSRREAHPVVTIKL